jgi:glycerophosphoryl diester phosphodiesterase
VTTPLAGSDNRAMSLAVWPYPRWIAHRGAGTLAPENTLAALRLGAAHGYRMAECDVKLSADGMPFLLHDATLERTTNGHGTAGHHAWPHLAALDAGGWHSTAFVGERLPTLAAVAAWCQAEGVCLNIEIKPTPGLEAETGHRVAQAAQALWAGATVPPLLTSFEPASLTAARAAAPRLPRGLLLDRLPHGGVALAQQLGCVAVVCHHPLWTAGLVGTCQAAGLRTLAYTVNDPTRAQQLLELGLDSLITDRVDVFAP